MLQPEANGGAHEDGFGRRDFLKGAVADASARADLIAY